MEQLIEQAAAALGYSATMVERSARARAQADGVAVEAVLQAWIGGDAVPATGTAPAAAEPAESTPAPAAAPAPEPVTPAGPDVEVIASDEPEPEAEPEAEPEPEPEPVRAGIPRWLAAAFIIVPLLAVGYTTFFPNGPDCGNGGLLAIDPATGEAVNCDGSEFGVFEIDFFAIGLETYGSCAACHGGAGGGGSGPAMANGAVLVTFPGGTCEEHVEWVRVGTSGWPDPTYGATDKPVGGFGNMPAFGRALSEEDLRAVVMYERVAFGGQGLEDAKVDCGLGGDGETVAAGG